MAIDIVVFHTTLGIQGKYLFLTEGAIPVRIFFFLSGYGLVYSLINKRNYLKGFMTKRLPKDVIPFIYAAIFSVLFFKICEVDYYGFGDVNITNVFKAFISNGYTIVYNSWYVVVTIALYIVFYIAFKIAKDDIPKGISLR